MKRNPDPRKENTVNELEKKVAHYREEIADLQEEIASCDESDIFGRIRIVEANAKVRDYQMRIERLRARIAGLPTIEDCPTDAQIAIADYVNSREYDND